MESHLLFCPPHYFQVLNPNAAGGKGGLPSVAFHLHAQDALLPSSFSFFYPHLLPPPQFCQSFFFTFYGLIISSLPLICFLCLSYSPFPFTYRQIFPPVSPPLPSSISHSCASSSRALTPSQQKSPSLPPHLTLFAS